MPTHCSILAWRIPWTEEPGGLPSTVLQRVEHDWAHTQLSLKEVISIKEPGSCRLLGRGCVCVVVTPPAAAAAAAAAKSLQSYPTLCDPIDGRPPGSLVPGLLQARTQLHLTLNAFLKALPQNRVTLGFKVSI